LSGGCQMNLGTSTRPSEPCPLTTSHLELCLRTCSTLSSG
jgi:hypothetical protein